MPLNRKTAQILLVLIFFACPTWAHNLKGTMKDRSGEPIPYATVYVKEVSLGTTTNSKGEFLMELATGTYTINFRCLGYIPQTQTIDLKSGGREIAIIMEEQVQQIQEVKISGTGEDPAYAIIRKVIGLSYVHLNQINSYLADVYIRGTVKIENIPGIIRNQIKKKNINVKTGDVLVNENISVIKFHAPDKYEQQIKSINSTFPEEVDFPIDQFLGSSLYQDNIDILFSPLGKNALSYYKYTYEGFDYDKNYTVNKIKVTPKRKSKQFFQGYIYIIENLWCLHRADLSFDTPFGEVQVRQVYDEVRPQVWLPVGHNYSFNGGLVGFKANAKFGVSVKYNNIELNRQVLAMANYPEQASPTKTGATQTNTAAPKTTSKSSGKRNLKIEQLLEKEKLNNADMNKLTRLMSQKDNAVKPDSVKSLELTDDVKVEVDKGANKRDTSYWSQNRPIPLSPEEITSFRQRDSVLLVKKTIEVIDSQAVYVHKRNYGSLNPLFFGKKKTLNDSTWQINYIGLFNTNRISFNPVDGLLINQDIIFRKTCKPGHSLELIPQLSYAFSRKALMGGATINLGYAPMNRGSLQFTAGRFSYDFNGTQMGIHPLVNTISSLFYQENYARYYESRQASLLNSIDITNGLVLKTGLTWKDTRRLENTTNFSFVKKDKDYYPNTPNNPEVSEANLRDQTSTIMSLRLEYTPKFYYRIRNGAKRMSHSDYPTFYVKYEKGIKNLLSSGSDYDFIGAGLSYGRELNTTSSIAAEFHTGLFTNNRQIHFSDFAIAPTQSSPILLKEYRHAFFLPCYYQLSTSDKFIRAHLSYKSPFIALKYLPVLSNTLWREMIWTSYYTTPTMKNHLEVGYTMLEVLLSANVGIFAGFDDGEFSQIGFNIAFRWAN